MAGAAVRPEKEGRLLTFLYKTEIGRAVLKILVNPVISHICGKYLDSKYSAWLVPIFIKKNNIDLSDFEERKYENFNECFTRKIKPGKRPIDLNPDNLIAPCDGLLSAYHIDENTIVDVKNSRYTIAELLRSRKLAREFSGGECLIFRLCVNHYHRYSYFDNGRKSENRFIPGQLHTVRPIAQKQCKVFSENSREYTIIDSENFGRAVQMEVGAMLVGKIKNHHEACAVRRGEEKGMFLYGGSTIILLLKKDAVLIPERFYFASRAGMEVPVQLGECIGKRAVSKED